MNNRRPLRAMNKAHYNTATTCSIVGDLLPIKCYFNVKSSHCRSWWLTDNNRLRVSTSHLDKLKVDRSLLFQQKNGLINYVIANLADKKLLREQRALLRLRLCYNSIRLGTRVMVLR